MKYLLGADIGTSSTKALLLSEKGKITAEASAAHKLYSPSPGLNEQNPQDWWKSFLLASKKCLRSLKKTEQVCGIGLAGQMHGSVFLDKDGRIIRRALLWNDQRTDQQCEEINERVGGSAQLIKLVSNVALTGYTAPKILWLRQREPEHFSKLKTVLLPKDYINFRLTENYSTDVSDASGTLLFDVRNRQWSREILQKLELDPGLFPKPYESRECVGSLEKRAAEELGLTRGIPVVAGAGDQAAAALGMGIIEEGLASATIGTSGVVFAATQRAFENSEGRLQSFCHAIPETWCVFGCMLSAGASLTWLHSLFPQGSIEKLIRAASQAEPGSGGVFFAPYLDGERCPHSDPKARGILLGLSHHTKLNELARAVLEGITFGMNEQLHILRQSGIQIRDVRLGGGGAKSEFWRELQADIYGARVSTVNTENTTALGGALLAGVSAGLWSDFSEANKTILRFRHSKNPSVRNAERFQELFKKYQAIYPAMRRLGQD